MKPPLPSRNLATNQIAKRISERSQTISITLLQFGSGVNRKGRSRIIRKHFHGSEKSPHGARASVLITTELRRFVQLVTDAANRQHVAGVLRIVFDFSSEAVDVRINVALVAFVFRAPHLVKQIVS